MEITLLWPGGFLRNGMFLGLQVVWQEKGTKLIRVSFSS